MSWMRSGTELSQFLRIFLNILPVHYVRSNIRRSQLFQMEITEIKAKSHLFFAGVITMLDRFNLLI